MQVRVSHHESIDTSRLVQGLSDQGLLWLRDSQHDVEDLLALGQRLQCRFVTKSAESPIVGGNSGRKSAFGSNSIFTVTGTTADGYGHDVPLHGELYFTSRTPPALLWFFCQQPAASEGATLVCDGAELFAAMRPELQQAFAERGVAYHRHHEAGVWPDLYGVERFEELEPICAREGIEIQLLRDGSVATTFRSQAVWPHSAGPVFINNVLPFALRVIRGDTRTRARVTFSDGQPIPDTWVLEIDALVQALQRPLCWQAGDIAVVDNRRCMHGRGPVQGGGRKVFVRMSSAPFSA